MIRFEVTMKNEQKTITNANEVRQSKPNVPTLRFRFNNDKWAEYPNSVLFSISSKKNHDGKESLVLSASQEKGMIPRNQNGIDIKYSEESVFTYKIIENGDYVIHLRSFQGGFAFSRFNGICSPAYTVLKPNKEILSNGFLENYFTSKKFIDSLRTVTFGIRDGKSISVDQWMTQSLFIPSKNEQEKIIAFIQKINSRIEVQNKIISKYETLIKGLCDKIFRHDKSVCLSDLVKCKTSTLQENEIATYYDGKYKVFGASGIIATIDKYQFEKDSILVLKDGSKAGKIQYAGGKYSVVGTSVVLIPNNADDARYLYFAMLSIDFDKYKVGSGIPHIYFKDYSYERIYYPNSALRAKIVKVLDAYETKVEIEKEMLSALQKQKAFLLQSMFI